MFTTINHTRYTHQIKHACYTHQSYSCSLTSENEENTIQNVVLVYGTTKNKMEQKKLQQISDITHKGSFPLVQTSGPTNPVL